MEAGTQQVIAKQTTARPEIVQIENRTFEVHFKVITICSVVESGKQIGVGSAQWNPLDEFNYDTGKKIALREAIKSRNDNFRHLFWEAYLSGAREHLKNRIREHRKSLQGVMKLTKAIAFELNEDLLKLKHGVFGCEKL